MWIEKSVTQDQCSASLGKPRDADQDPRDRFFYPHHTPMKETYSVQVQFFIIDSDHHKSDI